jgi:hypothetical protein
VVVQPIGQIAGLAFTRDVNTAECGSKVAFRTEEIDVNWWLFAGLVVFDIYVASLAIVVWAIRSAPLIPATETL